MQNSLKTPIIPVIVSSRIAQLASISSVLESSKQNAIIIAVPLSRVKTHILYDDIPCSILTASKGEWFFPELKDLPENKRNTKFREIENKRFAELKSRVRKLGYSYFPCKGVFQEVDDKGNPVKFSDDADMGEKSLFVLGDKDNPKKFRQDMMKLGKDFNQQSIFYKTKSNLCFLIVTTNYEEDGKKYHVGDILRVTKEWHQKIEELIGAYTKLKDGKGFKVGDNNPLQKVEKLKFK